MKLLIMPDGKSINGESGDAVVCECCVQNDYDVNEKHGFTDAEIGDYIHALDVAPAASKCWLCGFTLA